MTQSLQRFSLNPADEALNLYGLVDGARYLTLDKRLDDAADSIRFQWLLAGTELDGIRHAGPALVAFSQAAASDAFLGWLNARDRRTPMVSWLWSAEPFALLADHYKRLLFTRLPDGRRSLFRYYNPTVRRSLDLVLTPEQRTELMQPVREWLVWQPLQGNYLSYVGDAQETAHA